MKKSVTRVDGRKVDELRKITIETGIAPAASGSCLISAGNTKVICAVTVDNEVPRWMKAQKVTGGWMTAEYSMLPYSTIERNRRDVASGKISGRTSEIQRLIGRAFRAAVDLEVLGERTLWIDCDVLQADGGTRTASITGAFVALRIAIDGLLKSGALAKDPIREPVAAVSVGIVGGTPMLDLNYIEDSTAGVDMNVVMTASGKFVEVQGTGEESAFSESELKKLLALGKIGCTKLFDLQKRALRG